MSAVQPGSAPDHPAPEHPAPAPATWADGPPGVRRYGPGVPPTPAVGRAELTAERVWRADGPARRPRRWRRLARLSGSALTVIVLAASGVLLYLRLHHEPFRVTGVAITQQAKDGCGVDVTGRITTNGSAGTVSYEWLFRPDPQSPRALNQSVQAGQHAIFATVAIQGQGHGSTSQMVTLQVLGTHPRAASAAVVVSCP
ncbi:MAG TPA: hypothetical protein VHZ03_20440 [Trebonia sp.]|nr:hypothetical protein [Trebonia sp.]